MRCLHRLPSKLYKHHLYAHREHKDHNKQFVVKKVFEHVELLELPGIDLVKHLHVDECIEYKSVMEHLLGFHAFVGHNYGATVKDKHSSVVFDLP